MAIRAVASERCSNLSHVGVLLCPSSLAPLPPLCFFFTFPESDPSEMSKHMKAHLFPGLFPAFCGLFKPPSSPLLSFTPLLFAVRICSEMSHPTTNRPIKGGEGGRDCEMEMNRVRAGGLFFHPAWFFLMGPAEVWIQSAPRVQPSRIRLEVNVTQPQQRNTYVRPNM